MRRYSITTWVYTWASCFDKAMIEIARGNYWKDVTEARRHKRTGLSFWEIKFTQEVEEVRQRRSDAEIEFAIKEARDRADRMIAAKRKDDFMIAKSIEQVLEWALGVDNGFEQMMAALKAIETGTIQ